MVCDIWDLRDLINTAPSITDDLKETRTSIFSVHSKRETNYPCKVRACPANYKTSYSGIYFYRKNFKLRTLTSFISESAVQ